ASTGSSLGSFVSSGSGGLDKPSDISFGPDGHFYVLSGATDEILRYDGQTGAFIDVFVEEDDTYLDHPSCFKWRTGQAQQGPTVRIEDLTIQNGRTTQTGDETSGLMIQAGALVTIENVVIKNNDSRVFGGGIQNWGSLSMISSDVLNNTLPLVGGGVTSQGGGIFNAGTLVMSRTLVANNEASRGGGISNTNQGQIFMTNTTITSNRSYGAGGGIRNVADGVVRINYSTIVRNEINISGSGSEHNRFGGGIYTNAPAETYIGNSIVAENDDNRSYFQDDFAPDCYSSGSSQFVSFGQNIIGIKSGDCKMSTDNSDQLGGEQSPIDPMLGSLENRIHEPLSGSPAIDAGHASPSLGFFFNYYCPFSDQNLTSRPVNGDGLLGAACDIGAAEFFVPNYVIVLDEVTPITNGATINFGSISLGEVVEKTLDFKNDGSDPIYLANIELSHGFELTESFEAGEIEPGEEKTYTVRYSADALGDFGGSIIITIGGEEITQNVSGQVIEEVVVDPTPTPSPTPIVTPEPSTNLDKEIFLPMVNR
ncbi:MAG: choice-of-anchor Q domain-containing protein, partial [Chloroflexota bacterium]